MSNQLQSTILQKIVHDEKYCRKVLPFVKTEYFDSNHKVIYKLVLDFIIKYNKLPTHTALEVDFHDAHFLVWLVVSPRGLRPSTGLSKLQFSFSVHIFFIFFYALQTR